MTRRVAPAAAALLLLTGVLAAAAGQDEGEEKKPKDEGPKLATTVPPEKLEKILEDMGIEFKKVKGKREGVFYYDFKRGEQSVRLHNYNGKDLWIDSVFAEELPLSQVNAWNVRAKFSRAVQLKQGEKTTVSLESQLDCGGGVTDAVVRQFVRRFDGELRDFEKFLNK